MPERPPLSVAALEMLAREETRARHARYLDEPTIATVRTGTERVACVLCHFRFTSAVDSVCSICKATERTDRAVTDDELWHWGGAAAVREQQVTQDDGWA